MDHGWVLVMGFQLTGGAAGVQGHRVVWVCAAVSATIRIHDSTVAWWWPHPLCVFVSVDYDQRSPGATLQCTQPTGQNSLLQKYCQSFTVTRVEHQQTKTYTSFFSIIEKTASQCVICEEKKQTTKQKKKGKEPKKERTNKRKWTNRKQKEKKQKTNIKQIYKLQTKWKLLNQKYRKDKQIKN